MDDATAFLRPLQGGVSSHDLDHGFRCAPPVATFPGPFGANKPVNALTIDVEDWIQSVYDVNSPLTDCFVRNTHAVLELLARHEVRATFFVLGLCAEKSPKLVREIHGAGHEVQSHGYGHRLIHTQTRAEFREDIRRSKSLLEDLIGEPITGYRAPAFSITQRTRWALDELTAAGFRYDSSIFPMRLRRYGISGAPTTPYRLKTPNGGELLEIPVCTMQLGPLRLPAAGGGYLRLLPTWFIKQAIGRLNRQGHPAVLYMHPYELAPDEFSKLAMPIPWRIRAQQGLGRRTVAAKLSNLLNRFSFGPIGEMVRCSQATEESVVACAAQNSTGFHVVPALTG